MPRADRVSRSQKKGQGGGGIRKRAIVARVISTEKGTFSAWVANQTKRHIIACNCILYIWMTTEDITAYLHATENIAVCCFCFKFTYHTRLEIKILIILVFAFVKKMTPVPTSFSGFKSHSFPRYLCYVIVAFLGIFINKLQHNILVHHVS